jgi:hypothetical protein
LLGQRLTLRGYANHRKELGFRGTTLKAVQKAIATGRITPAVGDDGLIDPKLADRLWVERTRVSMQGAVADSPPPAASPPPPPPATSGEPADHAKMYAEGRARLTLAKAAQEELDLAERCGDLVPIEVHERRLESALLRVANVLDSLPGSWPPRLAMCKNLDDYQHAAKQLVRELKDELLKQADAIEKEASGVD